MSNSAIDPRLSEQLLQQRDIQRRKRAGDGRPDRLSLASALDLDPSGSLRLTAWAAKVTLDLSFTNAHILDESPGLALASGRICADQLR